MLTASRSGPDWFDDVQSNGQGWASALAIAAAHPAVAAAPRGRRVSYSRSKIETRARNG